MSVDLYRDSLASQTQDTGGGESSWFRFAVDAAGNGKATLQLLPSLESVTDKSVLPWTKVVSYFLVQGDAPVVSPETVGEKCPVREFRSWLYKNKKKDAAKELKPTTRFNVNVRVVDYPADEALNGRVLLWGAPKSVFEGAVLNHFEEGLDPFDLKEHRYLLLRAHTDGGFRKYDRTGFGSKVNSMTQAEYDALAGEVHDLTAYTTDAEEILGTLEGLYPTEFAAWQDELKGNAPAAKQESFF